MRNTRYAILELTEKNLLVEVDGCITGFRQPEGDYYPVKSLIEREMKKKVISTIGVNARYLKDALNSVKTDMGRDIVEIDVRNPDEPLIIKTKVHSDLPKNLKVILPVRINGE